MQGHSLRPLLDDPGASLRDQLVVEEDEPFDLARLGRPLRMRTLLTSDARLSVYDGAERGELFDLVEDPDEVADRFDDPALRARRGELFERLAREQLVFADAGTNPTTYSA